MLRGVWGRAFVDASCRDTEGREGPEGEDAEGLLLRLLGYVGPGHRERPGTGGNFLRAVWQRAGDLGHAGCGGDMEPNVPASLARSSSATGGDNARRW